MIVARLRKCNEDGVPVPEVPELEIGRDYEVDHIYIGQSHTSILLKGYQGSYASVCFDFFEDGEPLDIYEDARFNPYLYTRIISLKEAPNIVSAKTQNLFNDLFGSYASTGAFLHDIENKVFKFSRGQWVWYKGQQRKIRSRVIIDTAVKYLLAGDIDTPDSEICVDESELLEVQC